MSLTRRLAALVVCAGLLLLAAAATRAQDNQVSAALLYTNTHNLGYEDGSVGLKLAFNHEIGFGTVRVAGAVERTAKTFYGSGTLKTFAAEYRAPLPKGFFIGYGLRLGRQTAAGKDGNLGFTKDSRKFRPAVGWQSQYGFISYSQSKDDDTFNRTAERLIEAEGYLPVPFQRAAPWRAVVGISHQRLNFFVPAYETAPEYNFGHFKGSALTLSFGVGRRVK